MNDVNILAPDPENPNTVLIYSKEEPNETTLLIKSDGTYSVIGGPTEDALLRARLGLLRNRYQDQQDQGIQPE